MKELVDLSLHFHHETDKAILVSENGGEEDRIWLPKSQIKYEVNGGTVEVTLPVWLATDKGLV
jgi:hypothetical protein